MPAGRPSSASRRLLPAASQVFTPYGATEALPVANIGSDEILGETRHLTEQGKGVCVGRPVAGMQVSRHSASATSRSRTGDERCASPPGEIGEIVVRGPVVTRHVLQPPRRDGLAKIRDPRPARFCTAWATSATSTTAAGSGSAAASAHRVVTPHGTLFTDMVEPIFNTCPAWHGRHSSA